VGPSPATPISMHCRKCGYQLAGLSENRCPECGRAFDPANPSSYDRDPGRWRSRRRERAIFKVVSAVAAILAIFEVCLLCFYRPEWQREQAAIALFPQIDTFGTQRIAPGLNPPVPTADWMRWVPGPFNFMLERVTNINLHSQQLSKQQLEALEEFKYAEQLTLSVKRIDDNLACLKDMSRLSDLSVWNARVDNAELAQIGDLAQLRHLFLSLDSSVTDEGLLHLAALKQLTYLHLGIDQTSDAALAALKDMTQMRNLTISTVGPAVVMTDAGLAHLQNMKQLRELTLMDTRITDAGLTQLQAFPNLELLLIANDIWITDAGIPQLAALKGLKSLLLMRTAITKDGARQLQQAMPETHVQRQ
jgi:hypothetical protein